MVAVTIFLSFPPQHGPLRNQIERPLAEGEFAFLFQALMLVDQPFNMAPSLHAALTVILLAKYSEYLSGIPRVLLTGLVRPGRAFHFDHVPTPRF